VSRLGTVRLGSVTQRLRDVVALQIGVEREHFVDGRPLGDQLGEPGDGDAQSANAGSTAELVGAYCDAREGHGRHATTQLPAWSLGEASGEIHQACATISVAPILRVDYAATTA
jgi:hypothetical protein